MEAAEAHKAEGNKALAAKDFEAAVAAYTKALEASEGLGEAAPRHVYYSNRSAAHLSKGDATAALADAEACIEANTSWPKGYSRKGAALHALRRYDDAKQAYEAGLALAPGDAALQSGLEDVRKAEEASNRPAGGARANPLAGIFAPENLVRIAGHPVFSKYLADPEFMAKVQTLQTDPTAFQTVLLQDKRVMDVFGFLTGIDMRGGPMGEDEEGEGASAPAPAPAKQPEPEPEPEPAEEELTEAEREQRKRKREAVEHKEVCVSVCVGWFGSDWGGGKGGGGSGLCVYVGV
jgi:stress-induced-phosphoprotein 1